MIKINIKSRSKLSEKVSPVKWVRRARSESHSHWLSPQILKLLHESVFFALPLFLSFFVFLQNFLCFSIEDLIIIFNFAEISSCWCIFLQNPLALFCLFFFKKLRVFLYFSQFRLCLDFFLSFPNFYCFLRHWKWEIWERNVWLEEFQVLYLCGSGERGRRKGEKGSLYISLRHNWHSFFFVTLGIFLLCLKLFTFSRMSSDGSSFCPLFVEVTAWLLERVLRWFMLFIHILYISPEQPFLLSSLPKTHLTIFYYLFFFLESWDWLA